MRNFRKSRYFLLLFVGLAIKSYSQKNLVDISTYQNPIINSYLSDPDVIYTNGYYYLLASGNATDGNYIPIYRSKDLTNWEFVRGAVQGGEKTDWNYKYFWAPEVIKVHQKYYLYYTASPEITPRNSNNRIGVAVSDHIEGPYKNVGVVVPHGAIDGHPVYDQNGHLNMFYTIEQQNINGYKQGQIFADKMLSPTQVAGKPVAVITHHDWQEGAFILHKKDTYYLTYSCGNWMDSTYHIRYAKSKNIAGPYEEQADTLMKSNSVVKGPGHHSFFKDKYNNDWIAYHGWDAAFTARYPRIDRVYTKKGKLLVNGPTYLPQALLIK